MLTAFEFLPATDAKGIPVPPAQEFTSLLLRESLSILSEDDTL